jgi:hypothetical protein
MEGTPTPDLEGHRKRLREALGNTLSDEFRRRDPRKASGGTWTRIVHDHAFPGRRGRERDDLSFLRRPRRIGHVRQRIPLPARGQR